KDDPLSVRGEIGLGVFASEGQLADVADAGLLRMIGNPTGWRGKGFERSAGRGLPGSAAAQKDAEGGCHRTQASAWCVAHRLLKVTWAVTRSPSRITTTP